MASHSGNSQGLSDSSHNDPNAPILVAEKSEVSDYKTPFPCRLYGCTVIVTPTVKGVAAHLASAHGIHEPHRCPWPDGHRREFREIQTISVFRHIIDQHGWKFTWRCPWCGKEHPLGTRKENARRHSLRCDSRRYPVTDSQTPCDPAQALAVLRDVQKLVEERPEVAINLFANCPVLSLSTPTDAQQEASDPTQLWHVIQDLQELLKEHPELAQDLLEKFPIIFGTLEDLELKLLEQ